MILRRQFYIAMYITSLLNLATIFQKSREWDAQFDNYQKLFDHINSKPELNAELKFGTLEDYFTELRKQSTV
jgi:Glycosyl hydrolases family 38 N-terminal domain